MMFAAQVVIDALEGRIEVSAAVSDLLDDDQPGAGVEVLTGAWPSSVRDQLVQALAGHPGLVEEDLLILSELVRDAPGVAMIASSPLASEDVLVEMCWRLGLGRSAKEQKLARVARQATSRRYPNLTGALSALGRVKADDLTDYVRLVHALEDTDPEALECFKGLVEDWPGTPMECLEASAKM